MTLTNSAQEKLNRFNLRQSKTLKFEITFKCNNNCVFCCFDKKEKALPLKKIKKEIKYFSRKGGRAVAVGGGEPFVSKHLFEILAFAKQNGIRNLSIQTNGRILCYQDMVKELKNFEPLHFLVSFHFPNAELYKKYCRSNGFHQTVQGIKNLVKYNYRFSINTVIMKPNLHHLKSIIKFLKGIGVRKYEYHFIYGKNIARDYEKFVPRYSECLPVMEEIIKENKDTEISLKGIPVCVANKKLKNYLVNPRCRERTVLTPKNLIIENIFPNCKNCFYKSSSPEFGRNYNICSKSSCPGVQKDYVENYGIKEFAPIIK